MSGGSYEYLYIKIDEAAEQVAKRLNSPERRALAKLLKLVGYDYDGPKRKAVSR